MEKTEAPLPKGEENGDAPAAGELGSLALSQIGLGDRGPQGAAAADPGPGALSQIGSPQGSAADPGALQQIELPDQYRPQAVPAAGGVLGGAVRLFDLRDRRLQAAVYLMALGGCVVFYGTVLNPSANAEHVFAGFFLWTAGAAVALLTLGGADTGRAADRLEEALRAFF